MVSVLSVVNVFDFAHLQPKYTLTADRTDTTDKTRQYKRESDGSVTASQWTTCRHSNLNRCLLIRGIRVIRGQRIPFRTCEAPDTV